MPSWAHLGIGGAGVLAQRQNGDDVALQPMAVKLRTRVGTTEKKGIRGSNTFVATAALRLPAPNVVGIADTPVLLSPAGSSIPPSLRSGPYCGNYVALPSEATSCSPGALTKLRMEIRYILYSEHPSCGINEHMFLRNQTSMEIIKPLPSATTDDKIFRTANKNQR